MVTIHYTTSSNKVVKTQHDNQQIRVKFIKGYWMKKIVHKILGKFGYSICKDSIFRGYNDAIKYVPRTSNSFIVRDEFKHLQFSQAALQKLLDDYEFKTVLDIGAGAMQHSEVFASHGKEVTAIDFGVSVYYAQFIPKKGKVINKILGDFNKIDINEQYDCVWASHILEHQPNPDIFLRKVISLANEGGVIAITVPHLKHEIVGGHVSFWNAGLVLYRLVLAGIDCSLASVLSYGYNISVLVKKKSICIDDINIQFDCGDIRAIKEYLPKGLTFASNEYDDPFDGNIADLNWH